MNGSTTMVVNGALDVALVKELNYATSSMVRHLTGQLSAGPSCLRCRQGVCHKSTATSSFVVIMPKRERCGTREKRGGK